MNDYGSVRVVGTKAARKLDAQARGLSKALEQFRCELNAAAYGSPEHEIAWAMCLSIESALVSVAAQSLGMTVESYKQIYC